MAAERDTLREALPEHLRPALDKLYRDLMRGAIEVLEDRERKRAAAAKSETETPAA